MNLKRLKQASDDLVTLGTLAEAYSEVAARRMKRIRGEVLETRDFLAGIKGIFGEVNSSYRKQVMNLMKRRGSGKVTFLAHNGKTAAVLLSANAGLYGDIVSRTYQLFEKDLGKPNQEVTVIGRMGREFVKSKGLSQFTYFDLPDFDTKLEDLKNIIEHLVAYDEIDIYHGQYQSVVVQEPRRYVIAAGGQVDETQESEIKFLFEPDLPEIMAVFEKQIFGSMLQQTVRESTLAKFASRMMSLDRAGVNIKHERGKVDLRQRQLKKNQANRRQLNQVLGTIKTDRRFKI